MRKQSSHSSVRPIVSDAADLLLKCAGYQDDQNAAKREDDHHVDTYYAVDNDVVCLYLEPESNADYLEVFGEGSDSITTKSLAFLLGDFLFQSPEPLIPGHGKQKCRFLIIPPHDEELIEMLTAIHRKLSSVTEQIKPDTFEKLSNIFVDFEKKNDDQTLMNKLRQQVPQLVELFNPYRGPKAALSRFALLSDTVFQRIDTYAEDSVTFPLLDALNNMEDRRSADESIERWKKLLKKCARKLKPDYSIHRDAEVLATIEHVNSELTRNDSRKQVALITGSHYLFDAAENYRPRGGEGPSFAEKYLRHPQAFLSHPEFFLLSDAASSSNEDKKIPFKLIEWLTLFFPAWWRPAIQPQTTVSSKFLRTIKDAQHHVIDRFFDGTSNFDKDADPKSLINGWKAQVSSVAEMKYSYGLDRAEARGAAALAKVLLDLKESSSWSIEKLREAIMKESVISVSSLYSKTTLLIGLWSKASRKVSKGVPVLRFDEEEYKVTERYCDELVRILLDNIGKEIPDAQLEELHSLNEKVETIDPSLYHAHVVHSLAFMAKGHWNASLTLAKTALTISDSLEPSIRGIRRGREAAYLACIAVRRSATDRSGLKKAYKYLDESIKRDNEGCAEDIRFTAERLMLDTRTFYFELSLESKNPDIVALTDTLNKLYSLFNTTKKEKNTRVELWVQRQVLTHFFTLLFIVRDRQSIDTIICGFDIIGCVSYFQKLLEKSEKHHHKPEDDPYAHLISNISIAIWGSDRDEQIAKRDAAAKIIKKLKPSSPYDEKRFELLERCIYSLSLR